MKLVTASGDIEVAGALRERVRDSAERMRRYLEDMRGIIEDLGVSPEGFDCVERTERARAFLERLAGPGDDEIGAQEFFDHLRPFTPKDIDDEKCDLRTRMARQHEITPEADAEFLDRAEAIPEDDKKAQEHLHHRIGTPMSDVDAAIVLVLSALYNMREHPAAQEFYKAVTALQQRSLADAERASGHAFASHRRGNFGPVSPNRR